MNTLKNATISTVISLGMLWTLHAQNTQTCKDKTNTAITENLNLKMNKETETIIKCMTGFLPKEQVEQFLIDNGAKKNDIKQLSLIPDTLLYETIMELQTKYKNPNITFKRPKRVNSQYDWYFSKRKNTIHIDLTSIINHAKTQKQQNNAILSRLLDIWLLEMSHGKQDITFKKKRKDFRTFIKVGFDYDEMYDTEGTIEYEAHKILEKEIINEFLELYASKIDITNQEEVKRADYLFDRYEYTNKNPDPQNTNLIFMLEREDERALEKMKRKK